MGHYLQVIDSDWEKATSTTQKSDTLGAKTTHFNTYCGGSETFASVQELIKILGDSSVLSTIIEEMLNEQVPRVGADDTKIPQENRSFHAGDGANNGAVDESKAKLEVIISQMNTLTPSQIEAILRIVREAP